MTETVRVAGRVVSRWVVLAALAVLAAGLLYVLNAWGAAQSAQEAVWRANTRHTVAAVRANARRRAANADTIRAYRDSTAAFKAEAARAWAAFAASRRREDSLVAVAAAREAALAEADVDVLAERLGFDVLEPGLRYLADAEDVRACALWQLRAGDLEDILAECRRGRADLETTLAARGEALRTCEQAGDRLAGDLSECERDALDLRRRLEEAEKLVGCRVNLGLVKLPCPPRWLVFLGGAAAGAAAGAAIAR